MSETKKLIIESSDDELVQKETNSLRKEVRKQTLTPKRQKIIQQKLAEIDEYRSRLEKAKKGVESGIYPLLGKLMLAGFVVIFFVAVMAFVCGFGYKIILATLTLAFVFLVASTASQTKSLKLEREIMEYSAKLKKARKELLKLGTPPQS